MLSPPYLLQRDAMLEVARGIKKMEKNPNAYGWYLVNAQAKFREDDQIEKMKRQQDIRWTKANQNLKHRNNQLK